MKIDAPNKYTEGNLGYSLLFTSARFQTRFITTQTKHSKVIGCNRFVLRRVCKGTNSLKDSLFKLLQSSFNDTYCPLLTRHRNRSLLSLGNWHKCLWVIGKSDGKSYMYMSDIVYIFTRPLLCIKISFLSSEMPLFNLPFVCSQLIF